MSKKNTPISIYGKNKKLTDVRKYSVDGEHYRETISLDTANGNFGRSTKIEKLIDQTAGVITPGQNITPGYVLVTNKEELTKIQNDSARMNELGIYLKETLLPIDGAQEAFEASGMKDLAYGDKSWSGIPLPELSETEAIDKNSADTQDGVVNDVTPSEIFGGYKTIFQKHLKYPVDMFIGGEADEDNAGSQDYMMIEQFSYKPPQSRLDGDQPSVGEVLERGISRRSNLGDPMGSCILPIPNRLGVSQGVNWGEGRANAVSLGAFNQVTDATSDLLGKSTKEGGGLLNLLRGGSETLTETFNTVQENMRNLDGPANAGDVINAVIARSILGRIGINVDTEQFVTRETGAAINPNLELLFGGPQLRTFSFLYNFAPNDSNEAKVVRMIQRWFRQGMLAQKTTNFGSGGSLFLGSPNIFRICYKNNKRRIKGLNTFKLCAMTSCEIDFTPDGVYQSYEDTDANSMPVRSAMKVTFNELTPIFANDYNYDENDPSLSDIKTNIDGDNEFTEDDLGF